MFVLKNAKNCIKNIMQFYVLLPNKSWGSGIAGRSTGSMVTNFVKKSLTLAAAAVRLRRP